MAGLAVIGFIGMLGFLAGTVYGTGALPPIAYVLHPFDPDPDQLKRRTDRELEFEEHLPQIVSWERLNDMAARVIRAGPDGIETPQQAAAALLSQLRSSRGRATFFSGDREHVFFIWYGPNGPGLGMRDRASPIPRLASRAGYRMSSARLREINAELNTQQVAWFDEARQDAMIYRNLQGWLTLAVRN